MQVYDILDKKTLTVEIVNEGSLQRVHFYDRYSHMITEDVKEEMKWKLDRSSPADKIRDFVVRAKNLMADIAKIEEFENSSFISKIIHKNHALWSTVMTYSHSLDAIV